MISDKPKDPILRIAS